MVSRMMAGMGLMRDPTRMFYAKRKRSADAPRVYSVARLTSINAPGILQECFHTPVTSNTAIVCHQPTSPEAI